MFNKIAIAALFSLPVTAMAVTDTLNFNVEAVVPVDRQYVQFKDSSFSSTKQVLAWNRPTGKLESINTNLLARNTLGAITAYLNSDAELVHDIDTTKKIQLEVTVNGVKLLTTSANEKEILNKTDAAIEKDIVMSVSPVGSNFDSGTYAGTVTMMFEHGI